jgi:hypothetical protein
VVCLKRQYAAREDSGQDDDKERIDPHEFHLFEDGVKTYGRPKSPDNGRQEEKQDQPELFDESDKTPPDRLYEFDHGW